jgi:hypothetical protein
VEEGIHIQKEQLWRTEKDEKTFVIKQPALLETPVIDDISLNFIFYSHGAWYMYSFNQ